MNTATIKGGNAPLAVEVGDPSTGRQQRYGFLEAGGPWLAMGVPFEQPSPIYLKGVKKAWFKVSLPWVSLETQLNHC